MHSLTSPLTEALVYYNICVDYCFLISAHHTCALKVFVYMQQMERFKVVERETKTKAYSKEGVLSAEKENVPQCVTLLER